MDFTTFTMRNAALAGRVMDAASAGSKVAWLNEADSLQRIEGTARSIGDENGNFAGPDAELRDLYLRVTSTTGWEHFLAMPIVMGMLARGELGIWER